MPAPTAQPCVCETRPYQVRLLVLNGRIGLPAGTKPVPYPLHGLRRRSSFSSIAGPGKKRFDQAKFLLQFLLIHAAEDPMNSSGNQPATASSQWSEGAI